MNISRRAAGRALPHPVRAFKCLGRLFPEFSSGGVYVKYEPESDGSVLLFCSDSYSYIPVSQDSGSRDSFSPLIATYWFHHREEYT